MNVRGSSLIKAIIKTLLPVVFSVALLYYKRYLYRVKHDRLAGHKERTTLVLAHDSKLQTSTWGRSAAAKLQFSYSCFTIIRDMLIPTSCSNYRNM